jgi:nitroimidazol reductase NimA-like FMN-containing flavoprotein (pyridoxamine 5'-phosphate oxidase superfamily)
MTKEYILEPRAQVRRRDRAVDDDAWIRSLLHRAPIGITATIHNGQPFLNSNLFVYDEAAHKIYFHTAQVGRTRANIEAHEQVCFTVYEMGRLLPADTALEFSVEYAGVVVFGRGSLLTEKELAKGALQQLLNKYAPHLQAGRDYQAVTDQELARTAVYQIVIEQWSGKKKEVADDFPGAFLYGTFPSRQE